MVVVTNRVGEFDTPGAVDETGGSTWMEDEVIRGIDVDTDAVERLPSCDGVRTDAGVNSAQ